jgi:hypothetical protein
MYSLLQAPGYTRSSSDTSLTAPPMEAYVTRR